MSASVLAIYADGEKSLGEFPELAAAFDAALAVTRRSHAVAVLDVSTGARYSIAEIEQLRLPIRLATGWSEILPKQWPNLRRARWAKWLRTARSVSDARAQARDWVRGHECHGCRHRRGGWCSLQQLPCTVNPVLTFRTDMPGMACMGLGRARIQPEQIDMFEGLTA